MYNFKPKYSINSCEFSPGVWEAYTRVMKAFDEGSCKNDCFELIFNALKLIGDSHPFSGHGDSFAIEALNMYRNLGDATQELISDMEYDERIIDAMKERGIFNFEKLESFFQEAENLRKRIDRLDRI